MKRKLLLGLGLLLSSGLAKAQFTPYNRVINVDLDTSATYSFTSTQSATSYLESKPGVDATQFFPYPTLYTARALFAATATTDGQFSLASSKVTMKSPSAGLIKSSIYNIQDAGAIAKFAFDLDLTNYTGLATFAISFGNDDGSGSRLISASTSYANATGDIFGAFRIANGGSAGRTQYRNAAGDNNVLLTAVESLIKTGVSQHVEIFVNSTSTGTTYTHVSDPNPITLAANTYHVYVDNVKYGVDFPKSGTSYAQTVLDGITFEFNNNAAQETIAISNLSVTYQANTLPVTLTSFTGKKSSNGVELNWQTVSEQNNDYFEVLRSTDGISYTSVGTITGKGDANGSNQYTLTDVSPASGINYYQLKQVDKDGTATLFSNIVSVNYGVDNKAFSVYVAQEKINVYAYAGNSGTARLIISDIQGRKLIEKTITLSAGDNTFSVDATTISSGVLVAQLVTAESKQVAKFLK